MTIAPNYITALRLLRDYTNGTFDIYALAGRSNIDKRVAIMSAIQKFKTPQAKAGVNAIRATLYDLAEIGGNTEHARERAFQEWARQQIA